MLIFSLLLNMQSHPTWVRGLKLRRSDVPASARGVAPHMGAWIETYHKCLGHIRKNVTPFVGVWIETTQRKEWSA